jgi:hypothetical protein
LLKIKPKLTHAQHLLCHNQPLKKIYGLMDWNFPHTCRPPYQKPNNAKIITIQRRTWDIWISKKNPQNNYVCVFFFLIIISSDVIWCGDNFSHHVWNFHSFDFDF